MKNILTYLKIWIVNLLNFSKPEFSGFDCVDCVIENKAYFLLAWKTKTACILKIKSASYISFKKSASAYVGLPHGLSQVEIVLSNLWCSKKHIVILERLDMAGQTDFNIKTNFQEIYNSKVVVGSPALVAMPLSLNHLTVNILNISNLKEIINITYP